MSSERTNLTNQTPTAMTTSTALRPETVALNDLPKILLGRACRYEFIPIENAVSEGVRSRMSSIITTLEQDGYMFQRIPSASPVHEGHGLLKDILKDQFPKLKDKDDDLLKVCRNYQLWRFFSDNAVEPEEWQVVLDGLLGQIGQMASQMAAEVKEN